MTARDLRGIVAELLDEHVTAGAAIGFLDDSGAQTIVTAGARGAGRGPVEDDTLFAAASLTKPLFAMGVLALVDDGQLDLDRPLSEYVPAPHIADDERSASITARMVLSHTTGFPNWRQGPLHLRWQPGTRWGYSGEGFSYLQQVVERLTGESVSAYLTSQLLRPLGMDGSTFVWPDADEPRLAIGHARSGTPRPPFRPDPAKAAAGGLFTTAPDYLRFLAHCLAHEHRMFGIQVSIDDELAWGLGWGIELGEGNTIWQWGNDPGYKGFVIGRPADSQGIVVLTNGDGGADVYAEVVRRLMPGRHPSLEARRRPAWMWAMARRPSDLRPAIDEDEVRSLLRMAAGSDEHDVDAITDRYRHADARLLGIRTQGSPGETGVPLGTPIAVLGLIIDSSGGATITALAVSSDWRHQGVATSLVYGAAQHLDLHTLHADASGDVVEFFRASGFDVAHSAGTSRCRLDVPQR